MLERIVHRVVKLILTVSVFTLLMMAAPCTLIAGSDASLATADNCMTCHGVQGEFKDFLDGAHVSVYVNDTSYRDSVHGEFSCDACHDGFSGKVHPDKKYRSRKEFSTRLSRKCRTCHADHDIGHIKIHRDLLASQRHGQVPLCQDCHGAHDTVSVSRSFAGQGEQGYCMSCHGRDISMQLNDGANITLLVNAVELSSSVHKMLSCPDCHFGFTEEEHPVRKFKTARHFTLSISETCKRCHFDKFARVSESIHYKLLAAGRTDVPNCTDCHGSHGVASAHDGKLSSARRCAGCHSEEYEKYVNSVHGSALVGQGNPDVPVCIDCHSSHDIEDPLSNNYHEAIPRMCSACHGDSSIMDKYGLSTDVVKTYLGDFHGTTLAMYRDEKGSRDGPVRALAECTDCHGTHDITSNFGLDPKAVKENLAAKCRVCHTDAGLNFPDAWLSHYRPSLSHAPLVYIVNLGYRIIMPLMIIGLLLQILLHAWRYFSNR